MIPSLGKNPRRFRFMLKDSPFFTVNKNTVHCQAAKRHRATSARSTRRGKRFPFSVLLSAADFRAAVIASIAINTVQPQGTVAIKAGVSKRTVQRVTKSYRRRRVVEIQRGGNTRHNQIRLLHHLGLYTRRHKDRVYLDVAPRYLDSRDARIDGEANRCRRPEIVRQPDKHDKRILALLGVHEDPGAAGSTWSDLIRDVLRIPARSSMKNAQSPAPLGAT